MIIRGISFFSLIISTIFLLLAFGCHTKPGEGIDQINTARELLYLNKIDEAKAIIQEIDTLSFDAYEMGLFHLISDFSNTRREIKKMPLKI